MLDLDHIVEWLCGSDRSVRFRVAQTPSRGRWSRTGAGAVPKEAAALARRRALRPLAQHLAEGVEDPV